MNHTGTYIKYFKRRKCTESFNNVIKWTSLGAAVGAGGHWALVPAWKEHVAQGWLGDTSVRMGLDHHGGSALAPPGSPCPQPVPATPQGLGRRVPARGVPAHHPPPGLDGTALQRPPWLTRVCRGGCGTPGRRARAARHQLLVGIPQRCGWWAHGKHGLHWGIQTPAAGTGLRHDGREPRTTGTLTTSPTCWPPHPCPSWDTPCSSWALPW